jgi:putative ABC transport system permease protein
MGTLDRKLLRDIWRMRLHALGVIVVLACGLAVFVMSVGMRGSLERTRDAYYQDRRMADLAVSAVRAPARIATELSSVQGVAAVETRISGLALLDLQQIAEPASARLVSLPARGRPRINDLMLSEGRWPDPRRGEEVLVSEAFAVALDLHPGATLPATIRGRREALTVVGIANSPEFVFVAAPGELFPQPERFGVIWMGEDALERAMDMEGAFNEALFRLGRNADVRAVEEDIDRVVRAYGSSGVYGRDRMLSDRFLTEELHQLSTLAAFLPTFFLVVAAFLVNISLGRVIATERSNIGLLKSFGYSDAAVGWHYAKSALIFAVAGAILGSAAGVWFGHGVAAMYQEFYHFPSLRFSASPATFAGAWAAAIAAAGAGAIFSVWRAVRLPPAAALAPPRPASYAQGDGASAWLAARLDAKSRIILRRIVRFPRRAATTSIGIALAIALLIVARSFPAMMEDLLNAHFGAANRQDVTLSFVEPRYGSVLHAVERLPGVLYAEPFRVEDAVLWRGHRHVQEAIYGMAERPRLQRLIGLRGQPVPPPREGIVLARSLAERLGAEPGDIIRVEQTRGRRVEASVRVAGITEPMIGSSGYMEIGALARLMREPGRISGAHVRLDPAQYDAFNRALKETPVLAGASFLTLAERSMRTNFDEHVGLMIAIYSAFAAVMAGGVAFSAARVTLAEQERDLATLRVLGFTRAEVSYVLIGEIAVLSLLAVPLGALVGTVMGIWMMRMFETEMYSFSYAYDPAGYAFAIAFTLACTLAAALVVRTGVDRLDMVAVLKARD